jgi:hypothetical protein
MPLADREPDIGFRSGGRTLGCLAHAAGTDKPPNLFQSGPHETHIGHRVTTVVQTEVTVLRDHCRRNDGLHARSQIP